MESKIYTAKSRKWERTATAHGGTFDIGTATLDDGRKVTTTWGLNLSVQQINRLRRINPVREFVRNSTFCAVGKEDGKPVVKCCSHELILSGGAR